MKQIRDALVIGSGIIGAATALGLIRAGVRRVTLLEKGPLVSGMTRRNPGLVHPFYAHPVLSALAAASYELYSQWGVILGGKSPFVETGAAVISNFEAQEQFAQWTRSVPGAHELSPNAFNSMYPGITQNLRAVLFTPRAGYADAVLTAQTLARAAQERGLEVRTGTQVKQILVQQRQVTGVTTTTGEYEAPVVIVTAGAWSERLLMPLGVTLHLRQRRGIVAFYEQPPALTSELPIVLDANGAYFFRTHPFHMSAAGRVSLETQKQTIESLEEFIAPAEAANVTTFVQACIPAFANVTAKRAHSILYSASADGLPALGRISNVTGLFVATGFGTSAFAVAPAVGDTLAQMVIDGSAATDVSSFDPLRASS